MVTRFSVALLLLGLATLLACRTAGTPTPVNADIAMCQPEAGNFSTDINNPYFPLKPGATWTLEGKSDGKDVRLVITVSNETQQVAGVTARIVEERETANGALVEVSRNFFAQAPDGSVCYYGEEVDIYENGAVVRHDGAWRAGINGALPGVYMSREPKAGMKFRQEVAKGIAEDQAEIKALGEKTTVPAGEFTDTVRSVETTPLESGSSTKVFARDAGLIVDGDLRLVSRTP